MLILRILTSNQPALAGRGCAAAPSLHGCVGLALQPQCKCCADVRLCEMWQTQLAVERFLFVVVFSLWPTCWPHVCMTLRESRRVLQNRTTVSWMRFFTLWRPWTTQKVNWPPPCAGESSEQKKSCAAALHPILSSLPAQHLWAAGLINVQNVTADSAPPSPPALISFQHEALLILQGNTSVRRQRSAARVTFLSRVSLKVGFIWMGGIYQSAGREVWRVYEEAVPNWAKVSRDSLIVWGGGIIYIFVLKWKYRHLCKMVQKKYWLNPYPSKSKYRFWKYFNKM